MCACMRGFIHDLILFLSVLRSTFCYSIVDGAYLELSLHGEAHEGWAHVGHCVGLHQASGTVLAPSSFGIISVLQRPRSKFFVFPPLFDPDRNAAHYRCVPCAPGSTITPDTSSNKVLYGDVSVDDILAGKTGRNFDELLPLVRTINAVGKDAVSGVARTASGKPTK